MGGRLRTEKSRVYQRVAHGGAVENLERFVAPHLGVCDCPHSKVLPRADLTAFGDADTLSAWAADAMSWAVSEGIMGQGDNLWAKSSIERAQVAIMTVRFQPDGVEHGLLG